MGCDIHLYQEKRVNGKWVAADKWEIEREEGVESEHVPYETRLYSNRNYRLFAVLAGVRNGVGFAGVKTSDPVIPMALPRGVPDDACPEYKAEVERWGQDGHSHSWLTLHDIMSYPFKHAKKTGVMHLDTYRAWKRSGETQPEEWSGDVIGSGVIHIPEEIAAALADGYEDDGKTYVRAEWSTSLKDDCEEFLTAVVPRLQELESMYGEGNARLVFMFDN